MSRFSAKIGELKQKVIEKIKDRIFIWKSWKLFANAIILTKNFECLMILTKNHYGVKIFIRNHSGHDFKQVTKAMILTKIVNVVGLEPKIIKVVGLNKNHSCHDFQF